MSTQPPKGWSLATLGDVTVPKVPQGIPALGRRIAYIDIASIDNDAKEVTAPKDLAGGDAPSRARQRVRSGDVLVSMTRPNLNAVALLSERFDGAIASTGFDVLRAVHVDPRWIFANVRSRKFIEKMTTSTRGALYPAVNSGVIRSHPILLPPLTEQRHIVEKISRLDSHSRATRKHLDAIPSLLAQFRTSVLASAFSGRLTADWRAEQKRKGVKIEPASVLLKRVRIERRRKWEEEQLARMKSSGQKPGDDSWKKKYKEPEAVDERGLPKLPLGWCWACFWEVASIAADLVSPKDYQKSPHIAPDNIEKATGRLLTFRTVAEDRVKSPKHYFHAGQILYSKIRPYLSKVVLVDFHGLCSADMYPLDANIDTGYLYRFMLSAEFLLAVQRAAGSRVVLPKVNQEQLNSVPVPLAPSLEQCKIAELLDALLNSTEAIAGNAAKQTDSLKILDQAILAKAFCGELVPQNPKDEPASELLKRIAEEKEKMKAEKKIIPKHDRKPKREPEVSLA